MIFVDSGVKSMTMPHTSLEALGIPILYTGASITFSMFDAADIGLHALQYAIQMLSIQEEEFVVRIDGECFVNTFSPFVEKLRDAYVKGLYDCVVRYGTRFEASTKKDKCVKDLSLIYTIDVVSKRCFQLKSKLKNTFFKTGDQNIVELGFSRTLSIL